MKRRKRKAKVTALGLAPAEHGTREGNFAKQVDTKITEMHEAIASKQCNIAFAKLIDSVSYAGMAEAEADGAGKKGSGHAAKAAQAITAFKAVCRIGD